MRTGQVKFYLCVSSQAQVTQHPGLCHLGKHLLSPWTNNYPMKCECLDDKSCCVSCTHVHCEAWRKIIPVSKPRERWERLCCCLPGAQSHISSSAGSVSRPLDSFQTVRCSTSVHPSKGGEARLSSIAQKCFLWLTPRHQPLWKGRGVAIPQDIPRASCMAGHKQQESMRELYEM